AARDKKKGSGVEILIEEQWEKHLRKQDFCDTYRDMHPTCQKFTWSNKEAATRINYIWVSEELASGLQKAEIEEAEGITESNHEIIRAEI
ncbi:8608_t:CDS:2, partial [Paraglomus occultum]